MYMLEAKEEGRICVDATQKKNLGNELLSHTLVCSTIAAGGLNCRVRDGNGCTPSAMAAKNGFLPIAAGTMSDS